MGDLAGRISSSVRAILSILIDQPGRGRSAWQPDIDGKLTAFAAERIEQLFTAPETLGNWPQAKKHTQWPGSGRIGRPGVRRLLRDTGAISSGCGSDRASSAGRSFISPS